MVNFGIRSSLALGATFLSVVGCGGQFADRSAISGAVTLDGRAMEQGSIAFVPIDGLRGVATGGAIEHGRYQLSGNSGPMLGWHRIEIRGSRNSGRMVQKPFAAEGEMMEEFVEAVAPQYNTQSTLKIEIKPGKNTADFAVKSR